MSVRWCSAYSRASQLRRQGGEEQTCSGRAGSEDEPQGPGQSDLTHDSHLKQKLGNATREAHIEGSWLLEAGGNLSSLAEPGEGLVKDVAFERKALRSEESRGHVSLFPLGKVTRCSAMQGAGRASWAGLPGFTTGLTFPRLPAPSLLSAHSAGKQFPLGLFDLSVATHGRPPTRGASPASLHEAVPLSFTPPPYLMYISAV